MSDQPREPRTPRSPVNRASFLLRAFVITTRGLLLIGAVFLASRYRSNRRLMEIAEPSSGSSFADIAIEWDGPTDGPAVDGPAVVWLERWIGQEHAIALLCRPSELTVGNHGDTSDIKILSLLRESAGLKGVFFLSRDLPAGCLEAMATRHVVEGLMISLPVISEEDAKWLSRMTELKQLCIDQLGEGPRENDWSWLKKLRKLEKLEVTIEGATDRDVIALAECSASKELDLSGETLSDVAVSRLCELPSLERLRLEGPLIRLRFPQGQVFPSALLSIHLNCTGLDDESLAATAGLPQLYYVSIKGGTLSEAGLEKLAQLPGLRLLYLDRTKLVSDDALKALVSSTSLEDVNIRGCGTTPAGLIHLLAIPNLFEITFEDVSFLREPGTAAPTVTPDTVEEFLSTHRRKQEERDKVRNGPIR